MDKDIELLLRHWEVISGLAQGADNATDLSKKLGVSVAHCGQQLRMLEAYGIVKQNTTKTMQAHGKPRVRYTLQKEALIIGGVGRQKAGLKLHKLTKDNQFLYHTLFHEKAEELYYLQKFYYVYEQLIRGMQVIALISVEKDSYHFFVISENVQEIRTKYSNIILQDAQGGASKKIILWSHTFAEAEEGARRKEPYYVEKISKATAYYENGKSLQSLKTLLEGEG